MNFESLVKKRIYFKELYEKYSGLVRGVLYKIGTPSDVDDLVQEVFVKIWNNLETLEDEKKVKSWIYKITYHRTVDYYRKKKINFQEYDIERISNNNFNEHENKNLVLKALATLTLDQRTVITLNVYESLSLKEIGEILHIPEGTVKSRIYNAKQNMLKYLEKDLV